jgi:hypothetical protein
MSKSTKTLQALVKQFDELLPTLQGKPAADLLCEKSSVVRQQIEIEREDDAGEQVKLIAALKEQLAQATTQITALSLRVKELEGDNARLTLLAETPEVQVITDPKTAILQEEKDQILLLLSRVIDGLSQEGRVKLAVKIANALDRPAVETFAKIAGLDAETLIKFGTLGEVDLIRMSQAADLKIGSIARHWLAFKFPNAARVKVPDQQPVEPQPYVHMSVEEKIAAAKAQTRNIGYYPAINQEPA